MIYAKQKNSGNKTSITGILKSFEKKNILKFLLNYVFIGKGKVF